MAENTRATYGAGSLSETSPGSGVWRYRYRVDGVQLRKTFGSKSAPLTRKQAERAVRNMEPDVPTTKSAPTDGRTFGAVLEEWLDFGRTSHGKRWAPQTEATNRACLTCMWVQPVVVMTQLQRWSFCQRSNSTHNQNEKRHRLMRWRFSIALCLNASL